MLLDRRGDDDVQVLVLRGPVTGSDVSGLQRALDDALGRTSRGVVVDLTGTDVVDRRAADLLVSAAAHARWPRPSLSVCGATPDLCGQLGPVMRMHETLSLAVAHLDDRPAEREGREMVVEHGVHGPRQARQAVAQWAGEMGLDDVAADLLLVVSELVTNAVRYGAPPVRLALCADAHSVVVGVADAGAGQPVLRRPDSGEESGRGLLLLSLLSTAHGTRPDPPGKVVWASLPRA